MLLAAMQNNLAALYETPIEHCVDDFLITDARLADSFQPTQPDRVNNERLLLRQSAGCLDISLYIDRDIIDALTDLDPYRQLNGANLNNFLIALEGVSHFNYVIWNAAYEREFTQLELELQAEVDKFITALMLFDAQGSFPTPARVHARLFEGVLFGSAGDTPAGQRYREANHLAAKYCKRLVRRFPAQHREPSFINEIRRFYRLPQNQKIRLIEQH